MTSEIDGLKDWITKVEREGNDRHNAQSERLAIIERAQTEQKTRDEAMDKKMVMIIDILSQGRGVITMLKAFGWIVALGSGLALIWEGFFRRGTH